MVVDKFLKIKMVVYEFEKIKINNFCTGRATPSIVAPTGPTR
jgi:hypothetical protein